VGLVLCETKSKFIFNKIEYKLITQAQLISLLKTRVDCYDAIVLTETMPLASFTLTDQSISDLVEYQSLLKAKATMLALNSSSSPPPSQFMLL